MNIAMAMLGIFLVWTGGRTPIFPLDLLVSMPGAVLIGLAVARAEDRR